MASSSLVTRNDVETALLRPLTDTEATYVMGLCEQATAKLRAALPAVDARIHAYGVDPTSPGALSGVVVSAVLAEVVKRVLNNPTDATSISTTAGPYSRTTGYGNRGGGTDVRGLVITAADLSQLTPRAAGSIGAGTIRTTARWPY